MILPLLMSIAHRKQVLDAPGNHEGNSNPYVCQMCVSWPYREGFFNSQSPIEIPETGEESHNLVQRFAETWAEPFRSLALSIPTDVELKGLKLQDLPPPLDSRTPVRAVLLGDSIYARSERSRVGNVGCSRWSPLH